jgi:hypothetical protein
MKAPTVAINAICWWPQQLVSRQSAILSALYYSSSPLSVPEDLTKKNFHPASRRVWSGLLFPQLSRYSSITTKKTCNRKLTHRLASSSSLFTLKVCARNFLLQFLQQKKPSPFGSPTSSSASSLHKQSAQFWSEEAMQRENSHFPQQKKFNADDDDVRCACAPSHQPRARNEEDEDSVFHIPR